MNISKLPLRIQIELCNFCNAGCTHCGTLYMDKKGEIMDFSLFKKIVKELKKEDFNGEILPFFRGESFLVPNIIDYLSLLRKEVPKSKIIIYTNGSRLNEKLNEQIIKNNLLNEIVFSIDGGTKESFESIRKNISFDDVKVNFRNFLDIRNKLNKNEPKVLINMVITPENSHTITNLKKEFHGFDEIKISSFIEPLKETPYNKYPRFTILTKSNSCWRMNEWLHILSNGDVCLCCNDYKGLEIVGNVKKQSIKEIWSGEELQKRRDYLKKRMFSELPLCRNCGVIQHNIMVRQLIKVFPKFQKAFPYLADFIAELYARKYSE